MIDIWFLFLLILIVLTIVFHTAIALLLGSMSQTRFNDGGDQVTSDWPIYIIDNFQPSNSLKGLGLIKSTRFPSEDLPTEGVEPTTSDNGPLYKPNICAVNHLTTRQDITGYSNLHFIFTESLCGIRSRKLSVQLDPFILHAQKTWFVNLYISES